MKHFLYYPSLAILSTGMALWGGTAKAVEPYAATPYEIAQMPDYCQAKLRGAMYGANQGNWPQRFGDLWLDMHHYCHGLKFIQRASRIGINDADRSYNLKGAMNEFDYMLHSKNAPGHWFLPQIHLEKALVLGRMGRHAEAAIEYQQARPQRRSSAEPARSE